jgi:muconolactone delta-isomerase
VKALVICRPVAGVGGQEIAPHGADELAALRELKARGVLLEACSPGGPGAVLIFDADPTDLDELVAALPLRREGLIETETIELRPFDL